MRILSLALALIAATFVLTACEGTRGSFTPGASSQSVDRQAQGGYPFQ